MYIYIITNTVFNHNGRRRRHHHHHHHHNHNHHQHYHTLSYIIIHYPPTPPHCLGSLAGIFFLHGVDPCYVFSGSHLIQNRGQPGRLTIQSATLLIKNHSPPVTNCGNEKLTIYILFFQSYIGQLPYHVFFRAFGGVRVL